MHFRYPLLFPFLLLLFSAPLLAQVTDDFDDGLTTGWFSEGDGSYGVSQDVDPPNYSFRVLDNATGDLNFAIAPARYLGDWSAATADDTLALDFYVATTAANINFDNPVFEISGPGGRASALPATFLPAGEWIRQKISLSAEDWSVEEGNWEDLLANVTLLRILAEYRNGGETVYLDNVSLSVEPVRGDFSGGVCSTFEDGTVDGWRFEGNGAIRVNALDGNPGLGIGMADRSGVTGESLAPPKFWGDYRLLPDSSYLQFDLRIDNSSGGELFDLPYLLQLSNGSNSAYVRPSDSLLSLAVGAWHTYRFYLLEEDWTVTEGSWSALTESVEEIRLVNEFITGTERASLDNFCLQPGALISSVHAPLRDDHLSVYPNPAHGVLQIDSPDRPVESVVVFDLSGRLLTSQSVDAYQYRLRVDYQGVVVLRITTARGPVYRRVLMR